MFHGIRFDQLLTRRAVGALRAVSGLLFIANPAGVASKWVGSRDEDVAVLTRSVGARDLAIGLGLAMTGRSEWLAASIASDLTDGVDALVGNVPTEQRRSVLGWALGFAAYGAGVAVLASRGRRPLPFPGA